MATAHEDPLLYSPDMEGRRCYDPFGHLNETAALYKKPGTAPNVSTNFYPGVLRPAESQVVDPDVGLSVQERINLQTWMSNPLVARARMTAPRADVLSLFVTLHEIMHDLEDRFPGVTFRELLSSAQGGKPDRLVDTLRRAGCAAEDIAIVAGAVNPGRAIEIDNPTSKREMQRFELADALRNGEDIDLSAWSPEDVARCSAMATEMSATQRLVCSEVFENRFRSMKAISDHLGLAAATVRQALVKLRYHRSRQLHEWSVD